MRADELTAAERRGRGCEYPVPESEHAFMKKKHVLSGVAGLGVLLGGLGAVEYAGYSPGAPPYLGDGRLSSQEVRGAFRTWPEHDALYPSGNASYVLNAASGEGALLYFGAKHSRDADHPQWAEIEAKWRDFRPTVALHEGRSRGFLLGPLTHRIQGWSEPAVIHRLARKDGVTLYTLEPPYEDEVAALLSQWTPEQVALYFTLRGYWGEAQGRADDDLAEHLLRKRTATPALHGVLLSVADIDRVWSRDLAHVGEWRTLGEEPRATYLAQMSDVSREFRGRHMVRAIVDLVHHGERVFAVVGCSHVIRQENLIRETLAVQAAANQDSRSGGNGP